MDGFIIALCHISLMGRQGYAAAFDSGILDRNIVQFVQMVDYIGYIHRRNSQRTASAVQIGVVQFGILYRQRTVGGFQRGIVSHIRMHARTVCVITGSGTGVNFTLHFVLFRFSQAIEMIGKYTFGIVVYGIQYLVYNT